MKYIIDIPNDDVGRWIRGTPSGMKLLVPISIEDGKEYHITTDISVQNYSEFYQEDIENKVWELADYMCKMSPTERTLCFAFEYPSEVTTNFTFQEAKALFEKWMKSENEKETSELEEVVALANKLGIHRLYSLVKEIRGE